MQQIFKVILCASIFVLFPFLNVVSASAPYETMTVSPSGDLIETQTAYEPLGRLFTGVEIVNPEDIFIDSKGSIYVVDSGTKKVLVADSKGSVVAEIGAGILGAPKGVFVDEQGDIFVADYEKEKIFRFSNKGELEHEYGKPDSPLFGTKSPYKPQKVAVDRRGNIYVVGEGSTNGMMQLSHAGEFLGYYGVNRTEVSISSVLRNLIVSEKQKASLFMKTPPAPDNLAIDGEGLIYSVTQGTKTETIKKLNVAGQNMLYPYILDDATLVDITVDANGNMFVMNGSGKIFEYDSYGNLLFVFGGKDDGTNRLGLLKQPSGIAVDRFGRIYVSDKETGMIQVFESTAFSNLVHDGIALYKEGLYVQSQKYWESVLSLNSSFGLAHTAMGKAYYKQQQYDEALEEYRLAEDVMGYSDSFWEVRHAWMQKHLEKILVIGFVLAALYYVIKFLDKRKNILNGFRRMWGNIKRRKLASELLFLFRFFKHPIDSFYELQRMGKASVLSATILYLFLFVAYIIQRFQTGFIFSSYRSDETNIMYEFAIIFVPLLAFIIVNYLVSTINDGEGRFKDIYIGTIYSLAPYLVFILPLTLLSNILSGNEYFVYLFSIRIIYGWCLVILFIMIKEIHNYTISETFRNIFVTLFGMAMLLLVVFIIFVLMDQVYDFVYSIVKEALLRV
ncbi:SBBP repeat-containing protein [Bacillus sp. FJAT-49711]|uniref:SBBP repeat-containing protein n=1 Tax=Bacillus sp. FJAT-49711 TaxID=2833585 RepID=UPI001BCA3BDA|nr:SBBP repeat-containing protein [Bacillus sp. FJAT-49711]MBS4218638.1 SBBP repeat-containing protein [Bacillus sp. FJAT-49711]